MATTAQSSGLNIAQAAKIGTADFQEIEAVPGVIGSSEDLINMGGLKARPKIVSGKFNVATIIAAALVFIVVIAWFEVIRLFLVFAFEDGKDILFKNALANLVYAIVATVIAIFLLYLITKFWMKKDDE